MTKSSFPGFSTGALKFFRALEKNNNRDWFEANRQTYLTEVREPMERLAAELSAELTKFAPAFATEPKKAIFRIYRDTRFSSNKTPYKTHMGAIFSRPELGKNEAAGFYFEVSHKYVGVAAGLYMPSPDHLRAVRAHLLDNHERFSKIVRAKSLTGVLGELQGDKLTRPPKGFPCEHAAVEWVKHKNWYFWQELDAELATKPALVKELTDRFRKSAAFVDFLNEPLLAQRKKLAPLGI